ncbi:tetraacyldisaccharide 4'-kinase [Betaproteobacteria bacterium]|nr:tetraacyldisaccharide 4'-kinase [Betaproteobacteria bacterium]
MPHKKLESRVLNTRQTIIYNFSLNVQKHWYPSRLNGSFDDITNTSHASHKSKFINYCIKLSTRISFVICLPFFRLISTVYKRLTTAKNARKYETVSKLTKINKSFKLITVGNVLVGGVGKTPTVLAITKQFRSEGLNVAVVTKGYAGEKLNLNTSPEIIPNNMSDSEAARYFGDEPTLISRLSSVPVCVAKDRTLAIEYLASNNPELDFIVADDGIQSLHQFSEKKILVFDERIMGNGYCVPYGPMREPWPTPYFIDAVILNFSASHKIRSSSLDKILARDNVGQIFKSNLVIKFWENLEGKRIECSKIYDLPEIKNKTTKKKVLAVAGIGAPNKFFWTLKSLGLDFDALPLNNHEKNINDIINRLDISNYDLILTTEKDGVKLTLENKEIVRKLWKLITQLHLPDDFYQKLIEE